MDIDGGNQKQLTFGAVEQVPSCSPNSKWVLFNAWDTGKATIWKIPVEGGTPQQITNIQCLTPLVSHDGKLIACISGERVMLFSFAGGQPIATLELPKGAPAIVIGWTLDDRAIIYGKFSDDIVNFWIQPIDGSPPKQLTFFSPEQLAAPHSVGADAWSPDGRDLLYSRLETKSDVVMMSGLK
jgi:Tol biopolymer transport system component